MREILPQGRLYHHRQSWWGILLFDVVVQGLLELGADGNGRSPHGISLSPTGEGDALP